MEYIANVGVSLPKRTEPWIFNGKDQPKLIRAIFVTPDGYFPRMADITEIFGRSKREIEDRRIKRAGPKWDKWYKIASPTIEDVVKAIENVNRLYRWYHNLEDNCEVCNALDEELFKQNCWLVSTTHDCGSDEYQNINAVVIKYAFGGNDYKVTYADWVAGKAPHKS